MRNMSCVSGTRPTREHFAKLTHAFIYKMAFGSVDQKHDSFLLIIDF